MGKAHVCYYQTSISNTHKEFQLEVESQMYWTVEDTVNNSGFNSKSYLLRFASKVQRDQFRRMHTSERILRPNSFAARHAGWKDVSYISITKIPPIEEKLKKRKRNMTYKEAAVDILEYMASQGEWMLTTYAIKRAAIALDAKMQSKREKEQCQQRSK